MANCQITANVLATPGSSGSCGPAAAPPPLTMSGPAARWRGAGQRPGRADPARADPARTDPARTDPGRTDPARTDPARTDPARTDPARTDPARTDPARASTGSPRCCRPVPTGSTPGRPSRRCAPDR